MFSLMITALKKVETCRFIKHLKNLVASTISYITVNQSCLGSFVFTVSLSNWLTKLLRDDDCDYLIDDHITNF